MGKEKCKESQQGESYEEEHNFESRSGREHPLFLTDIARHGI